MQFGMTGVNWIRVVITDSLEEGMRNAFILASIALLSATVAYAETYSAEPAADTWVWIDQGPNGTSPELRTNIHTSFDQEIVIRFDLSSIPSGSLINSAVLRVYRYDGDPTGSLDCDLYRVTEPWVEAVLADSVAHDESMSYAQTVIEGTGWYEFDIQLLVQAWVDAAYENYGLVFYGTSSDGGTYQYFRSREAGQGNHPLLEVDYTLMDLEDTTFAGIKALYR